MSDEPYRIEVDLPEKSLVQASLTVVSYLDENGRTSYSVHSRGEAPMTTFLGLTVVAQDEIRKWNGRE